MATDEARETSSATTKLILGYVRTQAGDTAVSDVLQRAGLTYSVAELESDNHWVSYDARIRLMEAATAVLGSPDAMFEVGASALRQSISPSLVLLLRALGSPSQVFRQLPRAVAKFSTTSTMRVPETTATSALIRYVLHEGYQHSRLDCAYAQGLFSVVPEIFGLPAARILHDECESDGAPECVYHVTWTKRRRWHRHHPAEGRPDAEKEALRGQLHALQSAASDLVSADDLATVLERIVRGAASAVLAQGYLLAVHTPDGGTLVCADGVPTARREQLAGQLLAGGDLDETAVVVDVASSRTRHGRLAAIYPPGQRAFADEGQLLAAYARHAAAALDIIGALEESRRGQQRADALLELSRRLAATTSLDEVAEQVTIALPQVTECTAATFLLWDPEAGALRGKSAAGFSPAQRRTLLDMALYPSEVPELAEMMHTRQPLRFSVEDPICAALQRVMAELDLTHVIAVPIVGGDHFFGVMTVTWSSRQPPLAVEDELTTRLLGVADHAATALQNARLVSTVRHQALHDPLTALPNRVLFTDRLEQALRGRVEHGVAVLFCDLDRFKHVNDGLGHAVGDELLRQVAQRLTTAIRDGDSVGRLSGDEFAVLLPDIASREAAVEIAHRITAGFEQPFRIEGDELRITISIGVAYHHGPDGRVDQILRAADAAMYDAKQRGRNRVSTAAHQRSPSGPHGPSLERELEEALLGDQLRLWFQPIVDAARDTPVSVEALVRWQHPRLGLLTPAAFLPVAEETNLVTDIDDWVLREACRVASRAGSRVAVNLSGRTLADPGVVARVRDALHATGLRPDHLELEVVERRALLDVTGVRSRLDELRQRGIRVALDDFGTGYSTLSWLQSLPVDRIKLDRTFTTAITTDARSAALVRGVVALTRQLDLELVAEGVETPDQRVALQRSGVLLLQGHLVGRPSPYIDRAHGVAASDGPSVPGQPGSERSVDTCGHGPRQASPLTPGR